MGYGNGFNRKTFKLRYMEEPQENEVLIKVIDGQNGCTAFYTREKFLEIYDTRGWEGFIA